MTLTSPQHPDSWYADTIGDIPVFRELTGAIAVDICVVGGGYAGLATALELARSGKQVALLEAQRIGWGASGRNGGFVAPGFAEAIEQIERRCGKERAQRLYGYSQLGAHYVRHIASTSDRSIITADGALEVWRHNDDKINPTAVDEFNRVYSQRCAYWPRERIRESLDTSRYYRGVYDPDAFHIHPLHYAYALAEELCDLGAEIFEATPATGIKHSPIGIEVSTASGNVSCKNVVLCTSTYDRSLYPTLSRSILPVSTHVVVTEPLSENRIPIHTDAAIADTRRAGDYYRLIDGRRLLWGGKITTRQTPPGNLDRLMRNTIASVYPSLADVRIDYRWSGLMGYCLHKMPIIGELSPRIWAATAFGGHGINTTAMAGILIASAIAENDERWRDFAVYQPRWAGGMLGRLGVQLSYWGMQVRDRFDERSR